MRNIGSSPQVRGKHLELRVPFAAFRLIPAGAGKTPSLTITPACTAAHPRRCGENGLKTPDGKVKSGSSPQVRGKHVRGFGYEEMSRLIPAGAGKTGKRDTISAYAPAHPRRCGENLDFSERFILHVGSSPQVRGKPLKRIKSGARSRLIPAGAGKTRKVLVAAVARTAHPRRCGENPKTEEPKDLKDGSSPQVRGKLHAGLPTA